MMRNPVLAIALPILLLGGYAACAQQPDAAPGFWVTPAIAGFGRVHVPPNAAYKPDPAKTYKVVFAMTRGAKEPGEVNPALERVARTVNLYAASGVPLAHLEFVGVAYGEATVLALDDTHYRAKFGVANPNLRLIGLLRKADVDVGVCAQAVAENGFEYAWIDKSVTIDLSGLTTVTTLQQAGYALMPL